MKEIKYIVHQEIDKIKWDSCIAKSINGIIYAYSWYLDIVCPKWDALVYDDYVMLMPITHQRKYGFRYLYQPFYSQQLGIFSSNKIDTSLIRKFLSSIPIKYKLIEINLNKYNLIEQMDGFEIKRNVTYELDLIHSYENIFRKYKKNNIRNIRKAIDKGISIKKGINPLEIDLFLKAMGRSSGLSSKGFNILHQLMDTCIHNKSGYLYGAYNLDHELCAAAFFVYANQKACFILSVSSSEGKNQSAMFLLVDEFIKDFSGQNLILDFEGSNVESIARFYRGFGASPFTYVGLKCNRLPYPVNLLKN